VIVARLEANGLAITAGIKSGDVIAARQRRAGGRRAAIGAGCRSATLTWTDLSPARERRRSRVPPRRLMFFRRKRA
jgi:hypothetical protein